MNRARPPLTARRLAVWCSMLLGVLAICLLLGSMWGATRLDWSSPLDLRILNEVRLPRVVLAALLGGALTVAGVVFQALLRNPLADPYVLGVSGGASIGGVLALLLGIGSRTALGFGVPFFAFAGALGALLIIERIATVGGRLTVYTVLLTGAVFNAFSAALIYFLQSIASLEQLHAIVFYLMGRVPVYSQWVSLGWPGFEVGVPVLAIFAAAILLPCVVLFGMSRQYNALSLGEEGAMQIGVDVERLKRRTFVLGSLLTGLAVSVAGMIGFVGLIVPHLLRLLLGPDHRLLLPAAFLGGASFLVLADLASRMIIAPNEVPVGVVTALIGGPFFLVLLRRRGGRRGFG